MTYQEQLETFAWKRKRALILRMSFNKCYFCGRSSQLQVHHKYYVNGQMAWDYPDNALVALCEDCHRKIHDIQTPLLFEDTQYSHYKQLTPCARCGGSGYIDRYKHVEGGVCFSCRGARFQEFYGVQISQESALEMLDHISMSIQELAELTNNADLTYEFDENLIKVLVFENKKEVGFYYLSLGENMSLDKIELSWKFFEENIRSLRVVETQPDEGFLYLTTDLTESKAALECEKYRRIKSRGFHPKPDYYISEQCSTN